MVDWLTRLSKKRSRQGLYEFLEVEFGLIKAGSNVLTVGSGGDINKLLGRFSQEKNFQIISFDIDPKRYPDVVGDICTHDFKEKEFDVVVICEVLEHLHSPHLGLDNIYKILTERGKIILTTPFILPLHDRPYDYYRFTKYGLEFLLRKFSNVQIKERNTYFEAIDVLWVRLLQTNLKSSLIASYIIIPFIYFLKRPFTKLLSMTIRTDAMTTGYVVTAEKLIGR
jgi:SAM-dependent methyltransferase